MKILLVTEPGVNGVFRYVEALADFLLGSRQEVHLAYSDRRGSDRLGALVERVGRQGGHTINLRTANRPALADLRALRVLRALAAEVRPDIVHSHSAKAGALARLLPFTGLVGPRQVYQPHAYVGMRPKRGRADFAYNLIERVLARVGVTLCCSHDEMRHARLALRVPAARAFCIPNGVDLVRFAPARPEERVALRAALGLPAGGLVLGTMGRTSEQKDPGTLYRAFARLAAARPDVMLFHVGSGELDAEIARFIAQNGLAGRVLRRGYLSTPVDFYRAVDGFVLTSRYEGFSLALLEALACDLPLILSEAPGNGDVLSLPLSQLWKAPVADAGAFAAAMASWAQARSEAEPPRLNHRAIAREWFDGQRSFRRVLGLYQDLLERRVRATPEPDTLAAR